MTPVLVDNDSTVMVQPLVDSTDTEMAPVHCASSEWGPCAGRAQRSWCPSGTLCGECRPLSCSSFLLMTRWLQCCPIMTPVLVDNVSTVMVRPLVNSTDTEMAPVHCASYDWSPCAGRAQRSWCPSGTLCGERRPTFLLSILVDDALAIERQTGMN